MIAIKGVPKSNECHKRVPKSNECHQGSPEEQWVPLRESQRAMSALNEVTVISDGQRFSSDVRTKRSAEFFECGLKNAPNNKQIMTANRWKCRHHWASQTESHLPQSSGYLSQPRKSYDESIVWLYIMQCEPHSSHQGFAALYWLRKGAVIGTLYTILLTWHF